MFKKESWKKEVYKQMESPDSDVGVWEMREKFCERRWIKLNKTRKQSIQYLKNTEVGIRSKLDKDLIKRKQFETKSRIQTSQL